jgi:histidinol phosphatase-like enzyme
MAQARQIVFAENIRSGYNNTSATLAANRVVVVNNSGINEVELPGASTDDVHGVTMAAILDDEWGDVQIRGLAVCTAAAAITIGDRLMMDTAGKVLTWTAAGGTNAAVVGKAMTAATADGDLIEVELAGPGVVRQG